MAAALLCRQEGSLEKTQTLTIHRQKASNRNMVFHLLLNLHSITKLLTSNRNGWAASKSMSNAPKYAVSTRFAAKKWGAQTVQHHKILCV